MQLLFFQQMVVQCQDGVHYENWAIKTYLRITQHYLLRFEKVKETSACLQARLRLAPLPTCRGRPKWEPQGCGHSPTPAFQGPTFRYHPTGGQGFNTWILGECKHSVHNRQAWERYLSSPPSQKTPTKLTSNSPPNTHIIITSYLPIFLESRKCYCF